MCEHSGKTTMGSKRYNKKVFIVPFTISIIGFLICLISAQFSEDVNETALAGFILLSAGTGMALNALVKERYRLGLNIRFPLNMIFPAYPVIEDYDPLTKSMSAFRAAYSEFLGNAVYDKSNSKLQNHAAQLLWHCIYLQKRRLEPQGLQIKLDAHRRAYSKDPAVRSSAYFDGKYNVNDVYEEIYATKTFSCSGHPIKSIYNKEVAHYTFLSAKTMGNDDVVCPNCGSISSRINLIDGCDYCGTKFTVEDLDNRISSFGFRRDFQVSEKKRQAIRKLICPWIYMSGIMPMFYMGLFLPFLYVEEMNLFLRFAMGLFCGIGLGFAGFALVFFSMFFILPVVVLANLYWGVLNDRIAYRPEKEIEKEMKMAKKVRAGDPLFSIQSFFGNVQNKLCAIHFADNSSEVNAFSDCDLSRYTKEYKDVVDIDTLSLSMDSYERKGGVQRAIVSASLLLREFKNGTLEERKEILRVFLEKNEDCKTQTVCAPSILKCRGCGSSLSLMDGKTCEYCGRELDMKAYDWVIVQYDTQNAPKK